MAIDLPAPGSPSRVRACAPDPMDPRRWRNAPLAQRLFIVHNLMMRVGDRLVGDLGLTSSRWLLLGAIEQFEDPPTLSELSGNALLSLQNVSRMVASMESDGLVERFTLPGRGRATFVRMTQRGAEIHAAAEEAAKRFSESFLSGMDGTDISETENRLERMINNLEAFEAELNTESERDGK